MSAGEESQPLLDRRTSPEPENEDGVLSILADRNVDTDDVSLVATTPATRRNLERKSSLILDADCEDELAATPQGRSFLDWLQRSIMGQFTQILLLLVCLGVYTFTPEIINWSKMVDVSSSSATPVGLIRNDGSKMTVDRNLALTTDNWPTQTEWTGTVEWTGTLLLPQEGLYKFGWQGVDENGTAVSPSEDSTFHKYSGLEVSAEPAEVRVQSAASSFVECVPTAGNKCGRLKTDSQPLGDSARAESLDVAGATALPGQRVEFKATVKGLQKTPGIVGCAGCSLRLVVRTDSGEFDPLPRLWVRVGPTGHDATKLKPYKGKPYLDCSPVVVNKFFVVLLGVLVAFSQGGAAQVRACFSREQIEKYYVLAMCYCVADVAEILANSGLDPTVYIIFSQTRLLLTAVAMKVIMGTQQNTLQWVDLSVLTLLICIFQFTPANYLKSEAAKDSKGSVLVGLFCTVLKIVMSVGAGVYLQKVMQGGQSTPFAVQIVAMNTTSFFFSLLFVLPLSCWLSDVFIDPTADCFVTLLKRGPFAGPDGGWDARVIGVIAIYQVREWSTNLVVKRFDALVKNLCNAGATLASYIFGIWVMGKPGLFVEGVVNVACMTKFCTIFGVILLVYNYSLGKLYVKQTLAKA